MKNHNKKYTYHKNGRKTYYKVVTNKLKSIVTSKSLMSGEFVVQYKIDKWVKPKVEHSKLFIFDDLDFAKEWVRGNKSCAVKYAIFRVEVRGLCKLKKAVWNIGYHTLKRFWKLKKQKKAVRRMDVGNILYVTSEGSLFEVLLMPVKDHMMFCDEVKLVEKVHCGMNYETHIY